MTNNPTIDGVSRATIDRIADRLSKAQMFKESTEVRAILDAPAAERQEPVAYRVTYNDGEKGPWLNGAPIELEKSDVADGVIRAVECAYAIPTDSAALQSTIARLEARVAELESGRGEPAYYLIHTPKTSVGGEVTEWWPAAVLYTKALLAEHIGPYKVVEELFTAPPAPVAVVLPELERELGSPPLDHLRGLLELVVNPGTYPVKVLHDQIRATLRTMACLDATAALNEPAK